MEYQLNGIEPDIIGNECEGLYIIQHQENEYVSDPANTTFLKFKGSWHQIHFDSETIFWRPAQEPTDPVNDNINVNLVLRNLSELEGVVGEILNIIKYSATNTTVTASFIFSSGKVLSITHNVKDDFTVIDC